jgi:hypothetical protein
LVPTLSLFPLFSGEREVRRELPAANRVFASESLAGFDAL